MPATGKEIAKKAIVPISFSIFLAVRIAALLKTPPVIVDYGDAGYYISAGIAYVRGALPDSVNPEHPPLAKYIIGLFSVYIGSPSFASLLFGFLTAVVAFLLSRKLTRSRWAAATVWLLAFDSVSISTSVYPVLDGFMLFFAMLGVYLLLIATKGRYYYLAGISLGAAVACKWEGLFFAIPVLGVIIAEKKYLEASCATLACAGTYLLSYFPLIVTEGFGAFLNLQLWMLQFMLTHHGPSSSSPLGIIHRFLDPLIFNLTTFGRVTSYDVLFHPEGFKLLGASYISLADATNPLVMLLLVPILYWYLRNRKFNKDRGNRLIFWTLVSLVAWEILFVNPLELWFFAPVTSVISIAAAPALRSFSRKNTRTAQLTYVYLGLVPLWLVFASAIIALRMAHYWANS